MKRFVITLVVAVVLLILGALAAPVFLDHYRPRLEAAATDALGMDVHLGRLGIDFLPGPHLSVAEGRILGERGVTVVAARRIGLWPDLLPLLRGEFRLRRVAITQPAVFAERDRHGRLNIERLKGALPLLVALDGGSVSLDDGSVIYADVRSGQRIEAVDVDLTVRAIQFAARGRPLSSRDLSLAAELACGTIRTKKLTMSAVRASVDGKRGIFALAPITMRIFGGQMAASVHVDATGPAFRSRIHCSLPQFRIEEFLRTLSPTRAAVGPMDFVADLSTEGQSMARMVQTATGGMSLKGRDLVVEGGDLDGDLARYASSQNFNLVDVGAVFFAGPFGLAVTKGYGFASLFRGPGGRSKVRTVVSTWIVERGVARARDVALATSRNRIAMQGGLDFVHGRFADVTVAVIDAKGCAGVKQTIHGDFARPVVEKPRLLKSLAGPWVKLYQRGRGLFPAGPCEVFYSGSVAPPM